MRIILRMTALALFSVLFFFPQASGSAAQTTASEQPGDAGRVALGKIDFVLGEWEGEGWSLTPSGGRTRFWIKESYAYRGAKDLMDMEGRFRDILPDGSVSPKEDYALGILFYDPESKEYRMWHYSGNGTVFTVKMEMDIKARTAWYMRNTARGDQSKFTLTVGEDNVWVSKIEYLRPDNTWLKVMEFRMKRVAAPR